MTRRTLTEINEREVLIGLTFDAGLSNGFRVESVSAVDDTTSFGGKVTHEEAIGEFIERLQAMRHPTSARLALPSKEDEASITPSVSARLK